MKQAFYPLSDFPSFNHLAAHYEPIQQECTLLTEQKIAWRDWGSDAYDEKGHCAFLEGKWTVFPIYFGHYLAKDYLGEFLFMVEHFPSIFPQTTALLEKIPEVNFAAFTRLHPQSNLAPHKHKNPDSLIFHLGLKIPPGNTCGLHVGESTHTWSKPGDAVIFNDNLEHSAWNRSSEERTLLYVDFAFRYD